MTQNLEALFRYYTTPRSEAGTDTIYTIWERGEAFNDSVTPSTYVPEYRSHLILKFLSLTDEGERIFSLGCGNAAVEGALVEHGRKLGGIDVCAEAVDLARAKGVDAQVADFFDLTAQDLAGYTAVYADGFLGHLFDGREEIGPALRKLLDLDLEPGTLIVVSNDAPPDRRAPFTAHEKVSDFWYLSKDYLAHRLAATGLDVVESYYFPYIRPISGMRNRTICIARVH
ncbi:toxin biosynthesis protein [Nocardia thailandica]|uniref:toxin biosynthesis protein n=1 Tax=Nocardia thailandica TaxID=257275 RepID=UPI0005BE5542|nr:toxin biosynthesis protein [Nocardia thailandica]